MITVYQDKEALSQAGAVLFAEQARLAVEARGRFLVLLSGGDTPRESYRLLAKEPLRSTVPWPGVQLFWGDERWVPHDDPLSNLGMVRRALLDQVPLSQAQIHPIPFEPTPRQSALSYERVLRSFFGEAPPRFDLVLLGLGEDGHTASLFPGNAALEEQCRWVCEVSLEEQGVHRVTTTLPLLNQAALAAFMVAGAGKAAILRQVLEETRSPERLPAQLVKPRQGRLLWLADRDAAGLLREQGVQRR